MKYENPHIHDVQRRIRDIIRWQLGSYDDPEALRVPPAGFVYPAEKRAIDLAKPQVTWINHCTFLVEVDGIRLLTDPIWSDRCSPLSFVGPKRRHPPAMPLEALKQIDVVLISHNHYDHLDVKTVKQLHKQFPEILWVVPKGVKEWFHGKGIHHVVDLAWWETYTYRGLVITATPAQHYSGRGLFDMNHTLWVGYVVERATTLGEHKNLYFVGDTAYNEHDFKQVGDRFGMIDLCLCPIGTYRPFRFMRTVHSSPDDAVEIHTDVHAKLSIGMHWKTFCLSSEDMCAPPYDLYLAMKRKGLPFSQFLPLEPGGDQELVKKAAVILSGAGYLDGAEIHESVLTYLALAEQGIKYHSFALDKGQKVVVDHLVKSPKADEARNILQEAARIARGDISELATLDVNAYDMLWMPGGWGVAINLSNFAKASTQCSVDPEVERVIHGFYEAQKPIVPICISPAIVAKVLEGRRIKMTIGSDPSYLDLLQQMGQEPVACTVEEICVDKEHRIYSATGYMAEDATVVGIHHSLSKIAKLL